MADPPASVAFGGLLFGTADPARRVAQAYQGGGAAALARLRGFYSIAVDDGPRTTLAADHVGSRPLYFARSGDRLAHASSVHQLLAKLPGRPPLDGRAIADFVLLGFVLGERTFYRGVELVPAATTLAFERGAEVGRETWWRLGYAVDPGAPLSRAQWVERLAETFLRAVAEAAPEAGPFSLPLSGGMDSRAIAAALHALGKGAITYTIGDPASPEIPIAREVARRLGLPHRVFPMAPGDVLGWLEDGVRATDGMFPAFDAHALHLARRLAPEGGPVLDGASSCDGFYSALDVLRRWLGGAAPPWPGPARTVFTDPLFDPGGRLRMPELFLPERRQEMQAHLDDALAELRASLPADLAHPFDVVDFLELTQRTRRYAWNGAVLLRAHREVRHPFFHPDVLELVGRMPPALRRKEKPVISRMVARLAPELAAVPYERTGLPGDAGAARILVSQALRYARRHLPLAPPARRRIAIDYLGFLQADERLQRFVRSTLLGEEALARGLFAPDRLRQLVEEYFAGRRSNLALLSRLLSLELWQRGG